MKRGFHIAMGVVALIVILVVVGISFGWEISCRTLENGPSWVNNHSDSLAASGSTAASVYVEAPASDDNCGNRHAEARRASGNYLMKSAWCPSGTEEGTVACCVRQSWTAVSGTYYYASAVQTYPNDLSCGPTTATINNTNENCNQDSP